MTKGSVTNDDIMDMISQFATSVDARFDAMDQRFDTMDQRVDTIDQRISRVEDDLSTVKQDIRSVNKTLDSLDGRIQALEADIREIYLMLARRDAGDPTFSKLTLEKKLLQLNTNLLATAKQAGITLPR